MADCPDYEATCLFGAYNCLLFILVWFFLKKIFFCMNTMDVHVRRLIGGWGVRTVIKYILIEGDKRACTFH